MNKFFKKFKTTEGIGIIVLAVLVIFAGYMVYYQKDFKVTTSTKSDSNNKSLSGYYFQDYYDDYYEDEEYYDDDYYYENEGYYNDYYDDEYYDDYYDYEYEYEYYDYDDYYYNDYQYGYYDYDDTNPPSIKWTSKKNIEQYDDYDPMDGVSANHVRFGDVTDNIEIVYNDVDTDIPGTYTTVYKACNYPGSEYCRTVSTTITVREKDYDVDDDYYDYTKGPVWSDTKAVTCSKGSSSCSTYNVSKPTATDPVTGRELTVRLIEGSVNIYEPGTYALIYSAETRSGVSGTVSKLVTVKSTGTTSSSSSSNRAERKYISNYKSEYYDDGYYRGYLEEDFSNNYNNSKYISNYEWTNKVTYTYRCDNANQYGLSGWTLVSTDKSNGTVSSSADNHPTYYYNKGGYTGTLTRQSAYLKDAESKLAQDLGYCNNVGQTKQVNRTWIGVYSGYVYSNYNYNTTYSGYVYLYR